MKKGLIFSVALILLISFTGCLDSGSSETAKPALDMSGTRTSETTVGGTVEWEVTIKNNGPGTIDPLKVHLLHEKMDLLSITPEPIHMNIAEYPWFDALPAGQSITIKVNFVATEVGVADNSLFVDGYEEGLDMQTVIR